MPFLYVCAFSNAHVKVGCSASSAEQRIASHVDRVACMGVRLIDKLIVECAHPIAEREGALIEKCSEAAENRFQREWFTGLSFSRVCEWAQEAAAMPIESAGSFGDRLRVARRQAALTQADLGKGLGANGEDILKATISNWEVNRHGPNIDQLVAICRRLNVSADVLLGLQEA